MRLLFLVFAFLMLSPVQAQLRSGYTPLAPNVAQEAALLEHTNRARAAEGLNTLRQDEKLALAARQHAAEMATLNYLSHESPNALSRTAGDRVARAGSPTVPIGENIAKVGSRDVAMVTTQGWLDSPGHRANLLNATYTHVGFGTATARDGQVVVVQVLAYQPISLSRAEISAERHNHYAVTLDVELSEANEAVFTYGNATSDLLQLAAGRQRVELQSLESGQVHVRGAVRAPTGGGFILQDSGWLSLPTGRYQPDTEAPKKNLKILSGSTRVQSDYVYEVELLLDGANDRTLAVFVGDTHYADALTSPSRVKLLIPTAEKNPEITIGQVVDGSRVEVLMQLTVDTTYGKPQLVAGKG